jgi:hypothetical protein
MSGLAGKTAEKGSVEQEDVRVNERSQAQSSGSHDSILALQRAAGNRAVTDLLKRSSGKPLDADTREEMEARFGEDFREVRIHRDEPSTAAARLAGARAYTSGNDIVFGEGFYEPQSTKGKRLLAHELAHVVQQSRGGAKSAHSLAEADARYASEQAAGGQAATVQASASGGAQADPLSDDEIQKQIADNEAKVANASPEETEQLFKEREALQQQMSGPAPVSEAPSAPPQSEPAQAPSAPPAAAPAVQPFDPQAGNSFVKWLLYRNDTPVLDALTNDKNLKAAQDTAFKVSLGAATIATGGLASAAVGGSALTAGAIGGLASSTLSVGAKAAYKGELPTAKEAGTELLLGTLSGGVGGVVGKATQGLGAIGSGALSGAAGAATQTAGQAAITGKVPTAGEAATDILKGAAFGAVLSHVDSALQRSAARAGGIEPGPAAGQSPSAENVSPDVQTPPLENVAQAPAPAETVVPEAAPGPLEGPAVAETPVAEAQASESEQATSTEPVPAQAIESPVAENGAPSPVPAGPETQALAEPALPEAPATEPGVDPATGEKLAQPNADQAKAPGTELPLVEVPGGTPKPANVQRLPWKPELLEDAAARESMAEHGADVRNLGHGPEAEKSFAGADLLSKAEITQVKAYTGPSAIPRILRAMGKLSGAKDVNIPGSQAWKAMKSIEALRSRLATQGETLELPKGYDANRLRYIRQETVFRIANNLVRPAQEQLAQQLQTPEGAAKYGLSRRLTAKEAEGYAARRIKPGGMEEEELK